VRHFELYYVALGWSRHCRDSIGKAIGSLDSAHLALGVSRKAASTEDAK
jgi:hypothetical protein